MLLFIGIILLSHSARAFIRTLPSHTIQFLPSPNPNILPLATRRSLVQYAAYRRNGRSSSSPSSYGRGSGGGDITEKLNFKQIIKIDPNYQTPIEDMNCSAITKATLLKKGFTLLTPIQSQSYQPILAGEDIIGRSRTGTGKTLAFGIPIIEQIIQYPAVQARQKEQRAVRERGAKRETRLPLVLILEPTRELALQVAQELLTVGAGHQLRVSCVYGGASFLKQEEELRYQGCDIIVATPGRLLDHIQQQTIDLSSVHHIVLDEGDTMLEMGFQEDVEKILQTVSKQRGGPKLRAEPSNSDDDEDDLDSASISKKDKEKHIQMLLFSATMPSWIVSMTSRLMKTPTFLDAIQEGETRLAATIKHYSILLPDESEGSSSYRGKGKDRVEQISSFVEDIILTRTAPTTSPTISTAATDESKLRRGQQTIIFTNTKEEADRLLSLQCFQSFSSQVLHGDISQYMRQKTLSLFRQQYLDILISTDVAARGLDIQGVDLVIHLYPPKDVDSYVHRSGRTGRAGRNGTAIVFYSKREQALMNLLQRNLKFSFQSLGLPLPEEICQACSKIVEKKISNIEEDTMQYFLPYARSLLLQQQQDLQQKEQRLNAKDESDGDENLSKSISLPFGSSVEELLAKCMAAISQRTAITARSLVTGREGFLTLAFTGAFISRTPEVWSKFLLYYLGHTLAIDRFKTSYARLPSTIVFAMNDSKPMLLVDFEDELGREILKTAKHLSFPEDVGVFPCTSLPEYVQWEQKSSSTSSFRESGGGGGGGGGRYERSGGGGGGWRVSGDGERGRQWGGREQRGSREREGGYEGRDRADRERSFRGSQNDDRFSDNRGRSSSRDRPFSSVGSFRSSTSEGSGSGRGGSSFVADSSSGRSGSSFGDRRPSFSSGSRVLRGERSISNSE